MFSRTVYEMRLKYGVVFFIMYITLMQSFLYIFEFVEEVSVLAILITWLFITFAASLIATTIATRKKRIPIRIATKSVKKQIFIVNIIVFVAITLLIILFSEKDFKVVVYSFVLNSISFVPAIFYSMCKINKAYKQNVNMEEKNHAI